MEFFFNTEKVFKVDKNGYSIIDSNSSQFSSEEKANISLAFDKFSSLSKTQQKERISFPISSEIFWKSKTQRVYFYIKDRQVIAYLLSDIITSEMLDAINEPYKLVIVDLYVHYSRQNKKIGKNLLSKFLQLNSKGMTEILLMNSNHVIGNFLYKYYDIFTGYQYNRLIRYYNTDVTISKPCKQSDDSRFYPAINTFSINNEKNNINTRSSLNNLKENLRYSVNIDNPIIENYKANYEAKSKVSSFPNNNTKRTTYKKRNLYQIIDENFIFNKDSISHNGIISKQPEELYESRRKFNKCRLNPKFYNNPNPEYNLNFSVNDKTNFNYRNNYEFLDNANFNEKNRFKVNYLNGDYNNINDNKMIEYYDHKYSDNHSNNINSNINNNNSRSNVEFSKGNNISSNTYPLKERDFYNKSNNFNSFNILSKKLNDGSNYVFPDIKNSLNQTNNKASYYADPRIILSSNYQNINPENNTILNSIRSNNKDIDEEKYIENQLMNCQSFRNKVKNKISKIEKMINNTNTNTNNYYNNDSLTKDTRSIYPNNYTQLNYDDRNKIGKDIFINRSNIVASNSGYNNRYSLFTNND